MKDWIKVILMMIVLLVVISIPIMIGLTPLWVWIDNGHSINGGINDTPLSFGLAFIGTLFATGGINIVGLPLVTVHR